MNTGPHGASRAVGGAVGARAVRNAVEDRRGACPARGALGGARGHAHLSHANSGPAVVSLRGQEVDAQSPSCAAILETVQQCALVPNRPVRTLSKDPINSHRLAPFASGNSRRNLPKSVTNKPSNCGAPEPSSYLRKESTTRLISLFKFRGARSNLSIIKALLELCPP